MTMRDPGFEETEAGRYIDDDDYQQGLVDSKWDMCDDYDVASIHQNCLCHWTSLHEDHP